MYRSSGTVANATVGANFKPPLKTFLCLKTRSLTWPYQTDPTCPGPNIFTTKLWCTHCSSLNQVALAINHLQRILHFVCGCFSIFHFIKLYIQPNQNHQSSILLKNIFTNSVSKRNQKLLSSKLFLLVQLIFCIREILPHCTFTF